MMSPRLIESSPTIESGIGIGNIETQGGGYRKVACSAAAHPCGMSKQRCFRPGLRA
jgi:hypothetical protein